MSQVTLHELSIGYRGPPLLCDVTCRIEAGQRIGLLGRNGAGKTTLLRMLCGEVEPDHGKVVMAPATRVAFLPQEVPRHLNGTVGEVVTQGLSPEVAEPAWRAQQRVDRIVSVMELRADDEFAVLSSGMKRRVLLARALVSDPDLLLLDEPTNHLDIDAIAWLENYLGQRWQGTLIFVTHDRMFLRKLARRILEIDRGRLFDWSCDYDTFLKRKELALAAEEKQGALFDRKLAQEEAWLRQGIKARRTRNEGRVRALQQMRRERRQRQGAHENVRLKIQEGRRSGNLVADVEDISFAFGERRMVSEFSTTIMRGDKVGVIGANGSGKTTLLRLLLGKLPPQQGHVRLGTNLQIAYFDQLREQLDDEKSVQENVGDGYDSIQVGGKTQHVIGYLQNFLFTPERSRTPVRFLSGGERNRVLLARLFAKPANVIVLDEPTNDLDTETLELLEARLVQFAGTVLLVSHDREFLNNVVTSTIVFEAGGVNEYVGGYDDWLRQRGDRPADLTAATGRTGSTSRKASASVSASPSKTPAGEANDQDRGASGPVATDSGDQPRRLSYHEQRELSALPGTIEQLEGDISTLHQAMAEEAFYRQAGEQIACEQRRLEDLERQLATAYERWGALEQRSG